MSNFKRTLQSNIFIYLGIFSLLIVSGIWLFQIFFLNFYYESTKTDELRDALNTIKRKYQNNNNFYELLESYSIDKGICSEIIIDQQISFSTNPTNRSCTNLFDSNIQIQKIKFIESDEEIFQLKIYDSKTNNQTLLFGTKLDNNIALFVNTSIAPIDSTIQILRRQFMTITFIVVILSFIIAYFIAKRISSPISKMTEKTKELSKGNFDINFDTDSNIYEIDDLSKSLNYSKDVLKKNDELRRELMANVSHDLKTPLTMIKAYAEMIRDLTYHDEVKRTENLNVIIEEVDRLNLLVNDILELSKIENNFQEVNLENINLSELVDTIINRFQIFSITQDFTFIKNYQKNITIKADKAKLEQVIYNLIGNAINYTNQNKYVYITILTRKKEYIVCITDTGQGIAKDKIKDIWNKYYKIDKKYKRNTIGTGLGLSIVKNIFEQHNYQYGVTSKENLGTTFYFIINKKNKTKK